ncbi:MAG: hypothetical protein TEF_04220 [Rhizobiales bacterium NRL2]|jgi:hypothetical protein|nr:MAG: hypothetical protein TEF_04220 [Rhizobiales bacterium NRL2]
MALNRIQLCSRALLKVGASPVTSFEDGTAEAEIAALLYGVTRDALISGHPWSFATAQQALPALTVKPLADFDRAFALPADFLRVLSVGAGGSARGRGVAYRIHERRLHASAESLNLTYVFRPDETAFPPFFDQALIARLAAEFCLPLTENTARTEALSRAAEVEFARARSIDGQQQTPQAIENFALIEARS